MVWHGINDVRVDNVPDPVLLNPRDAIVRITSTAICGSDQHLMDGYVQTMGKGDILDHEFIGANAASANGAAACMACHGAKGEGTPAAGSQRLAA